MGEAELQAFLFHLAVDGQVAASTPNQALAAILFLYKAVLNRPLSERIDATRAKRPERLPVVRSQPPRPALSRRDRRLPAPRAKGPSRISDHTVRAYTSRSSRFDSIRNTDAISVRSASGTQLP
jgi:hypothetical protein